MVKNYFRIILEFFGELFVLVKNDITRLIINMRGASTPKLKLAAKMFHAHSFSVFLTFPSYLVI